MSEISSYVGRVNAAFDTIATGVDGLVTSLGGIGKDVTFLKETILKLQQNAGGLSPEDKALLDAAATRAESLATNVGAAATLAGQLDAATDSNPAPPPETPPV